jgi:glucokinase
VSSSNQELTIGLDVGGTEIKAGLLRGSEILATRRWATEREHGPEHAVDQVLLAAKSMSQEFPDARAVGVVVPGVVNTTTGVAEYSENIGWKNVPFVKLVNELTGLTVGFGHDVRAGGVAETMYGAGKGFSNSFFMPIGTGIAGAIVLNGELFDDPYAGEIGHLDVNSGYMCACGVMGCLESISTGPSILRIFNEKSGSQLTSASQVVEKAKNGNVIAQEVWKRSVEAIGFTLASYINILAPEIIILGGGVSKAGDALLAPIEQYLDTRLTFQRRPKLVVAELGDHAGMIGAGIFGLRATQ